MLLSGIITHNQTVNSNTVFTIPKLKSIHYNQGTLNLGYSFFSTNQIFRLNENPHIPVVIFISKNTFYSVDTSLSCKVILSADSKDLSLSLRDFSCYVSYRFIVNENTMKVLNLNMGLNIFEDFNVLVTSYQVISGFQVSVLGVDLNIKDSYYELVIIN